MEFGIETVKPVMTWAPSHFELGYLSEILRYANIIDGLNENEKRDLRFDLEILVDAEERNIFAVDEKRLNEGIVPNKVFLMGYDKDKDGSKHSVFCFEICLNTSIVSKTC